jgi:hypothetical protein
MPPSAVKTIRDLIYWQYGKIISDSAGAGKKQYAFVMERFKKLQSGEIVWSSAIREYVKEHEKENQCIYCGAKDHLSLDHLIPRVKGGPDITDNAVIACKSCNSSKSDTCIYEWFGIKRKDDIPRIAEGKYLKLLYHLHEAHNTLDIGRSYLKQLCDLCTPKCDCNRTLSVYCLESIITKFEHHKK